MRYEKSDRVQREDYPSTIELVYDIVETLYDESNNDDVVNVIAPKDIIIKLINFLDSVYIKNLDANFTFDVKDLNLSDFDVDILTLAIYKDGEIYLESAIDCDNEFYECDGFIYLHNDVDIAAIENNNRRCDAIIFDIDE